MRRFYCNNQKMENFLAEYGVEPRFYIGETAVYKNDKQLQLLLDKYEIKYSICKSRY